MDGFELLKQDHERVKRLCNELNEETSESATERKRQLFAQIEGEVKLHEECEEKVLYPTLRAHPKLKDIVLEGYQEHHVVDVIMGELRNLSPEDEMWAAKAKVMQESLEHHIEEEEEKMFPQARKEMSKQEIEELGRQMEAIKNQKFSLPDVA
jgi:hemerythrin-like domain-containing protein